VTLILTNPAHNIEMLDKYCKPHRIDPQSVISVTIEPQYGFHVIEYYNKDNHFCTIKVDDKA
jgi:hypothetical protein